MDETEQKPPSYSPERTEIATLDSSGEATQAESSDLTAAATAERQAEAKEIAATLAGKAPAEPKKESRYSPVTVPGSGRGESAALTELLEFLKQTKHVWLIVVGVIAGLILLATLIQRGSQSISKSRERRQEKAVASVTPEHLLARCGQPAEDTTRDMYPILTRTMIYQVSRSETYTFEFSRTAEDKSDWVFLSMKDATGKSYETPEEKVAAMSCLDSRK